MPQNIAAGGAKRTRMPRLRRRISSAPFEAFCTAALHIAHCACASAQNTPVQIQTKATINNALKSILAIITIHPSMQVPPENQGLDIAGSWPAFHPGRKSKTDKYILPASESMLAPNLAVRISGA